MQCGASLDCPLPSRNSLPFNLLKSKVIQKHLLPLLAFPSRKYQQYKFCLCILFSPFFSKKQIHSHVSHTHQESGTPDFSAPFLSKGNPLLLPAGLFLFILLFLWVFHWAGVPPRWCCWLYSSAPSTSMCSTNCLYGPGANRISFHQFSDPESTYQFGREEWDFASADHFSPP